MRTTYAVGLREVAEPGRSFVFGTRALGRRLPAPRARASSARILRAVRRLDDDASTIVRFMVTTFPSTDAVARRTRSLLGRLFRR